MKIPSGYRLSWFQNSTTTVAIYFGDTWIDTCHINDAVRLINEYENKRKAS